MGQMLLMPSGYNKMPPELHSTGQVGKQLIEPTSLKIRIRLDTYVAKP